MYKIKNNSDNIFILLITVFVMLTIISCSMKVQTNNDISKKNYDSKEKEIEEELYDFELLYSYKNIFLTDNDKVEKLVNQMQCAKELPIHIIEYTDELKRLRVDFCMNVMPGQEYKVNYTKWMADAVMLFSLIDELDAVEYNLVQANYGFGGVPIERKQAEEVLGGDIENLGKTKELFLKNMPKKIAELKWDPDVMDVIPYDHIMGLDE